ncbi:uncharacterized protein LOC129941715 [Eupeodes corollae]|uniref:uncharacterized protein LOC129941715 n=1 Tax=Eupeodes corollae TaxID=290404 RepID=UPI0024902120|nr:uncharacterized protein LOC129941715 [Eupeodes corollae]
MAKVAILVFVGFLIAHFQGYKCFSDSLIRLSRCHIKENVSLELAHEFSARHEDLNSFYQLVENNPNLKCMTSCVYEFLNLIKGCSATVDEKFDEFTTDDNANTFRNCASNLSETDRCECAYEIEKCARQFYADVNN